jgi:hypothetical protein
VPFAAIRGFFDPSVNFGLQFAEAAALGAHQGAAQSTLSRTEVAAGADSEKSQAASDVSHKSLPVPADTVAPVADTPDKPAGGAEVVRLDRFRKK